MAKKAPETGDKRAPGVLLFEDNATPETVVGDGDTVVAGAVVVHEEAASVQPTKADYEKLGYTVETNENGDITRLTADKHVAGVVVVDGASADALDTKEFESNGVNVTTVKTTAELSREVNKAGAPPDLAVSADRVSKRATKALKQAPGVKKVTTDRRANRAAAKKTAAKKAAAKKTTRARKAAKRR